MVYPFDGQPVPPPGPAEVAGQVNGHRHDRHPDGRHPNDRHAVVEPGDTRPAETRDKAALVRRIRRQAAEKLTAAARDWERTSGLAMPAAEREPLTRRLISEVLDAYAAEEISAGRPPLHPRVESRVARTVEDSLLGAGGLQRWLKHPDVEEIRVNGCDQVTVRYGDGTVERVEPVADRDEDLVDLVRVLAARSGVEERRWDRAAPILNLELPDGSRLNAVMALCKRPSLAIRRHRHVTVSIAHLVRLGTLDRCLARFLTAAVRARCNILISGRVGAGKTTTLRALASVIPPTERIVTIEDTLELALDADDAAHPDVVALQERDPNVEGVGAVTMADLFRTGLRMLPDRVIVGEVRGREVIPMLNAMSQGNDGSLGTIHASSSAGVFKKLVLYAAQSPERLSAEATNMLVAESVDLVVHLAFDADGRRVVTSVREVVDADGLQVVSNEIFHPDADGRAVPGAPITTDTLALLRAHGFDPDLLKRAQGWWDDGRAP